MVRVYKASLDLRDNLHAHLKTIQPAQASFHFGTLDGHVDPGLHVKHVGEFSTPFYERECRSLIRHRHESTPMRYIRDPASVKYAHIPGEQLRTEHPTWYQEVGRALQGACNALDIDPKHVKMALTALIVDGEGSDMTAENAAYMHSGPDSFATLAIFPASAHEGGELEFFSARGAPLQAFSTSTTSRWGCTYGFWLAGASPYVNSITSGYRIALVYDLIFNGPGNPPRRTNTRNDVSGLRDTLRSWCIAAPADNKLPKSLVIPLQNKPDDVAPDRSSLGAKAAAQVAAMDQLATQLDLVCYLTNVKTRGTDTFSSSQFTLDPIPVELDQIVNMDGSSPEPGVQGDVSAGVRIAKDHLVPPDFYKSRAAAQKAAQKDMAAGSKDMALLVFPRQLSFDFVLETTKLPDKQAFIRSKLKAATENPIDDLLRQYTGRVLEIVMDSDPTPFLGRPNAPYLDCTQQTSKTCLEIGLGSKLLAELQRRRIVDTAVVLRITRAIRAVLGTMPFNELSHGQCCRRAQCAQCAQLTICSMTAAMKAYDNINSRWKDNMLFLAAATKINHTACIAWQKTQLDGILDTPLGYRPTTTSCLIEISTYHNDPAWFRERLMPKLHDWSGDVELIVGFLYGLTTAPGQRKCDRATLVFAVEGLSPKIIELVPNLKGNMLAKLHNVLLLLELPEKMQAFLSKVALDDTQRLPFHDTEFLSGLANIIRCMRIDSPPASTSHYRRFVVARLERYLWRIVKSEPSNSVHRGKAGCRKCLPCANLDNFLELSQTEVVYQLSTEEARHVIKQVRDIPDHYQNYDVPYSLEEGEPLRISKKVHTKGEHQRHVDEWKLRTREARSKIKALLESKQGLRDVLGKSYDDILHLRCVRLVRDAEGKEIGPPPYSRVVPVSQPASLSLQTGSGDGTSRKETTFSEIVMHSAASLKRKSPPNADADQENIAPPAKRSLVIDLGSDDEDD